MALIFFSIIHIVNINLVGLKYLNIELLVSFANIFFISNALLGIFASMKLFKNKYNIHGNFYISFNAMFIACFFFKKNTDDSNFYVY